MQFFHRTNFEVVVESRILSARYATFVTIMSRKLLLRMREVDEFNNQITNMSCILVDKDIENKILI